MKPHIFALCVISFLSLSINAQWRATNGPGGGNQINELLVVGSTLYAATGGNGIFVSTNLGQTWTPINQGLTNFKIASLARIGSTMLAGSEGGGIFRSVNNGNTWQPSNIGLTHSEVTGFAIRGAEIFAGTWGKGVFRSRDDGISWQLFNNNLAVDYIDAIHAVGNDVFFSRYNRLFRLSANDTLWQQIGDDNYFYSTIHDITSAGGYIYLVQYGSIRRSGDGGQTWQDLRIEGPGHPGSIEIVDNCLFVGTDAGTYLSTDNGASWRRLHAGLGASFAAAFTRVGNRFFAGLSDGTVYALDQVWQSFSITSAASYLPLDTTSESIVAAFGNGFTTSTIAASSLPLPTSLAGLRLYLTDSNNITRECPIFFVSPNQINFLIPSQIALGAAFVTLFRETGGTLIGELNVQRVQPAIFSANSDGRGVLAGIVLRIKANGSQIYEPIARFDTTQNRFVSIPIDVSNTSEKVFLVVFGSGWRAAQTFGGIFALAGEYPLTVTFAGAAPGLIGVDQLNLQLFSGLRGRGEIDFKVRLDSKDSNTVKIRIQ